MYYKRNKISTLWKEKIHISPGLLVAHVHKVIRFEEEPWFKSYNGHQLGKELLLEMIFRDLLKYKSISFDGETMEFVGNCLKSNFPNTKTMIVHEVNKLSQDPKHMKPSQVFSFKKTENRSSG